MKPSPKQRRHHLHAEETAANVALSADLERLYTRHHLLSGITVFLVCVLLVSLGITIWLVRQRSRLNRVTNTATLATTDTINNTTSGGGSTIQQIKKNGLVISIGVAVLLFLVLGVVLFLKWNTTKDFMKMFSRTLPSQAVIVKKQVAIEKKTDKIDDLEKQLLSLQASIGTHESNITQLNTELSGEKSEKARYAVQLQIEKEQKAIMTDQNKFIKKEKSQENVLDEVAKLRRELVDLETRNATLMKKLVDAGIPLLNPESYTVEALNHEIDEILTKIRSGEIKSNDETHGSKLSMWQEALDTHKDTIAANKKAREDWEQDNKSTLLAAHDKTQEAYKEALKHVTFNKLNTRWPVFKLLNASEEHIKKQIESDFAPYAITGLSLDELMAIYVRLPKDGFTTGIVKKNEFKEKLYKAIVKEQDKNNAGEGIKHTAIDKLVAAHRNVSKVATTTTKTPIANLSGLLKKNVSDAITGSNKVVGKLSASLLTNALALKPRALPPPANNNTKEHEK